MLSQWYELKPTAIKLRKRGFSIRKVEKLLKIPRSTLSGWFKEVKLTHKQKHTLENHKLRSLAKNRKLAAEWHRQQKRIRLAEAKKQANHIMSKINLKDESVIELALAMLYLGEGAKTQGTSMGNSDPLILKFFIACLTELYEIDLSKIKCELHLRNDQNPNELKNYWSRELKIPIKNIRAYFDKRTIGSKTYSTYKGVCVVRCGNIALQRRMVYLGQRFCESISRSRAVSSAG